MNDFNIILEKVKEVITSDYRADHRILNEDIADKLGISKCNFTTMKRRGKIPYKELILFCASYKISINWLFYNQAPESVVDNTNIIISQTYVK